MNTLKTLLYMGIMHGFFTYYFPYQLALRDVSLIDIGSLRFFAFPLWMMGTLIILWCSVEIIRRGRGTPAHLDPPKILIINGLYHLVRNPIYLGALLVLFGYILWFTSAWIILYTSCAFTGFNLLIIVIEEPILKSTFGAEYVEYAKDVPRWIPKLSK